MTATTSPQLGHIHALLAERGYEVSEPSPDSLSIREVQSGVTVHAVLQGEILFLSLTCVVVPSSSLTPDILALMLERKKMLRQVDRQRQDGLSLLVYEHLPSGEVWLIEDPGLKLGELKAVQDEVAHLLAGPERLSPPPAAPIAPVE